MKKLASILLATLFSVSNAQAALQQLVGDNVIYEYDDVDNAAALLLFGTPTISGDTVEFLPPNFRAESNNGAGVDIATANFVFSRVYSIGGEDLQSVTVLEDGDYQIFNGDGVSANLRLTVSDGESGTFDADTFSSTAPTGVFAEQWGLSATVNPMDYFGLGTNDVGLTIQNTLMAWTDATGELAWIQKKLTFTTTTVVPVPAAAWLFGSALLGLGVLRRRR